MSSSSSSTAQQVEYLEKLSKQNPQFATVYTELISLTRQKLWHQLSDKILQLIGASSITASFITSASSSASPSTATTTTTAASSSAMNLESTATDKTDDSAAAASSSTSFPAPAPTLHELHDVFCDGRLLEFFHSFVRKFLVKKVNTFALATIANAAQLQSESPDAALEFLTTLLIELGGSLPSSSSSSSTTTTTTTTATATSTSTTTTTTASTTTTTSSSSNIPQQMSVSQSTGIDSQALTLIELAIVRRQLQLGGAKIDDAKQGLDKAKKAIDNFTGVMAASVHSFSYLASMEYYKLRGPAADYFTSAILYLTYTPLSDLPHDQQRTLGVDIATAALIGTNIYNFGELLQHPIFTDVLSAGEFQWLAQLLMNFNNGQIQQVKNDWSIIKANDKSNVLSLNEQFLNEKLRIMTFMELVFHKEPTQRTISFVEVSRVCDLGEHEVEWLLMRALALKVVRGEIDEVAKQIRVTWVQPRVLDKKQLKSLRDNLQRWTDKLQSTILQLEDDARELISNAQ